MLPHLKDKRVGQTLWALGFLILATVVAAAQCSGADKQLASDLDPTLSNAIKASVFTDHIEGQYVGSGTAIATNGKLTAILTAAHVVPRHDKMDVVWYDGTRSHGSVFCRNERMDVALAFVEGKALGIAPLADIITSGQTWAIGWPGRKGPTTRQVEFKGLSNSNGRKDSWYFRVVGGQFGRGSSGSGIFRHGQLVAMTTHGDRDENSCAGRDALKGFLQKACEQKDCPFNIFDPFGILSGRRRGQNRGESQFDNDPNVTPDSKQLPLPGTDLIRGLVPGQQPRNPPVERQDPTADRLDRMEDSMRLLKTDLLRDVADIVATAIADNRSRVSTSFDRESSRYISARRADDLSIEEQVEQLQEQARDLRRSKARLLSELKRRADRAAELVKQLETESEDE